MSDDGFNLSMRKFLKTVGVTSQQQIEDAVRQAREAGTLGPGPLKAKVTLTLDGLDMVHQVEGEIDVTGR